LDQDTGVVGVVEAGPGESAAERRSDLGGVKITGRCRVVDLCRPKPNPPPLLAPAVTVGTVQLALTEVKWPVSA
jgi:hypothetical protein